MMMMMSESETKAEEKKKKNGEERCCAFRVACVQFEPAHGDRTKSFERCLRALEVHEEALLRGNDEIPLSIIQCPEMCFTGYTFDSREEIEPLVEWDEDEEDDDTKGRTRQFLYSVAKRFQCLASAGYVRGIRDANKIYNAVQIVDETGRVVLRANKHHLYCIDETWADEDIESGFTSKELVLKAKGINSSTSSNHRHKNSNSAKVEEYRIRTTIGICMDINPYKFEAPWGAFEFAKAIEKAGSALVLFASAWTNAHPDDDEETKAIVPDRTETWNYWFNRLLPLFVDQEEEEEEIARPQKRAFVFANRVGVEREIRFVGSSVVFQIERGGKLIVKGGLDNKKEGVLVAHVECSGVKVL